MKKILALLLCVLSVLPMMLVSCDEGDEGVAKLAGKTPEEIYEGAQTKIAEYDRFKVEFRQDIKMSMQGMEISLVQDVVTINDGQNSYIKAYSEQFGEVLNDTEAWYVDGWVYSNIEGTKLKAELPYQTYVEQFLEADPSESLFLNVPSSWFSDMKFEKEGDNYALKFKISGEKYTEIYEGKLDFEGDIGDVSYTILFDGEGNPLTVTTKFNMNMTISGIDVKASVVSTGVITVDGLSALTPPADADTYQNGFINY